MNNQLHCMQKQIVSCKSHVHKFALRDRLIVISSFLSTNSHPYWNVLFLLLERRIFEMRLYTSGIIILSFFLVSK